jgi:ketosteroid isomerase-like protein
MNRRSYFAATGAAVSSLAGCTDLLGSDSGGDGERSDAEQVVVQYYEALNAGDADRLEEVVHSDSPQEVFQNFEEVAYIFEDASLTLEETEIVEEGEDRILIDSTYTEESEFTEGGSTARTDVIELRRENGEWKIWDDRGFQ